MNHLAVKAARYAANHPQDVHLSWIDGSLRQYSACTAVELCGNPRVAPCLMGAVCQDSRLQGLLDTLIDEIE